ncbi:hypothetical protein EII29_09735 [Leptotrichia sp. OH3620_COT-345]|uniref:hypothetical protein n=1 Tax=Leptotrichia sp. OH3620_COT-345 TaxID=2491048 RepID=UPI000F647436|nr:hypothetical protein [Leptotrichia sp. OH3620_COT-345]RRD38796.1 hypothetical protein EII29_09735 [Leptotrichia sp. OH3620_COT-345]
MNFNAIVKKYKFENVKLEKGILSVGTGNKKFMIDTKTNKILLFPSVSVSLALEELQKIKDMIKEMRWELVIE